MFKIKFSRTIVCVLLLKCGVNCLNATILDSDPTIKIPSELTDLYKIAEILKKGPYVSEDEYKQLQNFKNLFRSNAFSTPSFSGDLFSIDIENIEEESLDEGNKESLTVSSIGSLWSQSEFNRVHKPVNVGKIKNREHYSRLGQPRVLHMPIKFPGDGEIRVPAELEYQREFIEKTLSIEKSINPNLKDYYAYLTVDQRFVCSGKSARIIGAHVDGLPRLSEPRTEIDHSYVVSDTIPVKFYIQAFPYVAQCDISKHHVWQLMSRTADEVNSFFTEPYSINLMNAYSVHTATNTEIDVIRTFSRLEFSKLRFDREGNTVNPSFDYNWKFKKRPIPTCIGQA